MTRAPLPGLSPGQHRVEGAVAHYLARVRRLRAGDAFVAFDPATGLEADAAAVTVDRDAVVVRIGTLREGVTRASSELTWIQGLAKGDKCDSVVRDATELGVTCVRVAVTKRSVVRLDAARAVERQARWARIAQEASRQCGRSDAPLVDMPSTWTKALDRPLATDTARFCLWERATEALAPALLDALETGLPLAFACGPEGGLEEAEAAEAAARGWRLVSLGRFILRTETVAAAVLGAVRVLGALEY